jgi:hypothetical protein
MLPVLTQYIHEKAMKAFIIVIAVATVLGGFVGGELTGNTFMLTGAVIGGVGTAAVLLGLGAFFTAQEEKKRKKALTPEIRGVFDRMLARQAGQAQPRKSEPAPKKESKEETFVRTVSGLLSPQLAQGRESARKAFGAVMTDKRAQGYVFGMHDAMLQALGLRGDKDSARNLMEGCYKGIFGEQAGYALLSMSLGNQDDPVFHKGRMEGGGELDAFLDSKTRPAGLAAILQGGEPDKTETAREPARVPDHGEFGKLMFQIQQVFRKTVSVPEPKDAIANVLQRDSIYGAIIPFAYGLTVLRLVEEDSGFIGSPGHEGMRRMVEDRMVKSRTEITAGMAASMPRMPGGPVFQPDTAGIRKKVQEELRAALEAVAEGGRARPRIAAQANLLQAYVEAAPFAREPSVKETLLAEMSGFSDLYLRNGLRPD